MADVAAQRGPILPDSPTVLADRAAVGELPRLYALGVDLRDEAMVRSVFAPDAVMRGALGEALADEYVPKLLAGVATYAATMHNITNQYTVVDGEHASVWSYAVALHLEEPGNGRADMAMGVHYRDQATRTDAGWIVTGRETVRLWVRGPFPR
jgi:SnoaL-like domain